MSETTALYRHFDAAGNLLYVGISIQPFTRTEQHSRNKQWWPSIATISIEWFDDREAALTAERDAIANEYPRHNVVHVPTANQVRRGRVRQPRVLEVRGHSIIAFQEACPFGCEWGRQQIPEEVFDRADHFEVRHRCDTCRHKWLTSLSPTEVHERSPMYGVHAIRCGCHTPTPDASA